MPRYMLICEMGGGPVGVIGGTDALLKKADDLDHFIQENIAGYQQDEDDRRERVLPSRTPVNWLQDIEGWNFLFIFEVTDDFELLPTPFSPVNWNQEDNEVEAQSWMGE